jgi:hypothetical protein
MTRQSSALLLVVLLSATAPAGAEGGKADDSGLQGGSNGKRVTLDAARSLELGVGSELARERSVRLDLDGNGSSVLVDVYRLVKGRVDVRFRGKANSAVMIRAPRRVTAVAKTGHFRVLATPTSASVAALETGTLAAVGNDWKPLAPGRARSVSQSSAGSSRKMLGAPQPSVSNRLLIATDGTASASVSWPGLKGAARYQVEIERNGSPSATKQTNKTSLRLQDLEPGRYTVSVSAVDAFELAGTGSPEATIQVVGLSLPAGARVEAGRVWLAADQRAELLGAQGLEMTYGRSSYFVPAPRSVGLSRGEPTLLRLRAPESKQEANIRLAPIELSASIELSPKRARWPRDPVRIAVSISAKGTDVPTVTPSVTVNGAPEHVTWKRSGNSLHAVVPPKSTGGPWVVRVEVRGPRGHELGRGFLEVAGARKTSVSLAP